MSQVETTQQKLQNLIRLKSLKGADREQEDIDQYMANAAELLADADRSQTNLGRFILAYEGMHCVALAVLIHLGARPGDGEGHRSVALQFAVSAMGLEEKHPAALRTVMYIHATRNEKIYRDPVPPLSKKSADAAVSLLKGILPNARRFLASDPPDDENEASTDTASGPKRR